MAFLLVQAAAAWYATGVIWIMQILNYPLLARIAPADVPRYEQAHNRRFGLVVGPGVAAALIGTVGLLLTRPAPLGWLTPALTAVLLLVVIVSTVAGQARAHTRLARRFDPATHAALVRGNWIRTLAWTALAGLDLGMIAGLTAVEWGPCRDAHLASRSRWPCTVDTEPGVRQLDGRETGRSVTSWFAPPSPAVPGAVHRSGAPRAPSRQYASSRQRM